VRELVVELRWVCWNSFHIPITIALFSLRIAVLGGSGGTEGLGILVEIEADRAHICTCFLGYNNQNLPRITAVSVRQPKLLGSKLKLLFNLEKYLRKRIRR
jgi:hypothetical protein